ncbi:MAG: hypothetical protein D6725_07680 [Planctomycetota bacterium]|nr:MAG: hypothetical protein D6725_07680 [Planctomycetota bacterium]
MSIDSDRRNGRRFRAMGALGADPAEGDGRFGRRPWGTHVVRTEEAFAPDRERSFAYKPVGGGDG